MSARYTGLNRIPILLLGPLLGRLGHAEVPVIGGCAIGQRPVDFHLRGLEGMGAEIQLDEGTIRAGAATGLRGCHHRLPYPSVGATENLVLAAVSASGTTVIENAAIEPEVIDLILFLQKMGATIMVDVDRRILVSGGRALHGARHRVPPDRIEIASYAAAAVASGGSVDIRGAQQLGLLSFLNALRAIGGQFEVHDEGVRFWSDGSPLRPHHIETDVHPGFMTDWQQPTVVLLTQAHGPSVIHETVYEQRLGYVDTLGAMGARIHRYHRCLGGRTCRFADQDFAHSAVVIGPTRLEAGDLEIPDLRAGFAYVLAAALAEGESRLTNVHYLERGYEDIPGKLRALGGEIVVD